MPDEPLYRKTPSALDLMRKRAGDGTELNDDDGRGLEEAHEPIVCWSRPSKRVVEDERSGSTPASLAGRKVQNVSSDRGPDQ
jgi:hypothetical protein